MSAKSYPGTTQIDTLLNRVVRLLQEMDTPAYLVGGAVRDRMLSVAEEPPYDLDFAVPGDGLSIARYIADTLGAAFFPLDAERGVGRIVVSDNQAESRVIDIARFQGPDLATDLAGRDFTVNAMAMEMTRAPFDLIDPHGGQADLNAGQLRAVSDQALDNDPVRGLRAVRLAVKLGFEIEPHTQTLIRAAAHGLSQQVSAERVRDELVKIISLPAVADSLRDLDRLDLLAEILPEVTALKGLPQTGRHRWDAYEHTLHTLAALETLLPLRGDLPHPDVPFPDTVADHLVNRVAGGRSRRLLLTLATLLHDIGKRQTFTTERDRPSVGDRPAYPEHDRVRFIDHERVGAAMAADVMRRLRFAGDEACLVETIVRHHLRPLQLAWQGLASQRAIHRFFRDTGNSGVDIALLSLADHWGTGGLDTGNNQSPKSAQEYLALLEVVRSLLDAYFYRQQSVVAPPPLLNGHDLIQQFGLSEGPGVGHLLTALREAQAVGQVTSRQQAEVWVKRKIKDWRFDS